MNLLLASLAGIALFLWPFAGLGLPALAPAVAVAVGAAPALGLVELGARRLDARTLALVGVLTGFGFGALMDVWDWTYFRGSPDMGWAPGMSALESLAHFGRFYLVTSLSYDAFRAGGNLLLVLLLGPPVVAAMRRMRARFTLEVIPTVVPHVN